LGRPAFSFDKSARAARRMGFAAPDAECGCDGLRMSLWLAAPFLLQGAPRTIGRSGLRRFAPGRSAKPRILLRPDRRNHVGCRLRSHRARAKELRPASDRNTDSPSPT